MTHLDDLLRCEVQRDIALAHEQRLRKAAQELLDILATETHLSDSVKQGCDYLQTIIARRETLSEVVIHGQITVA